MAEVLFEHRLPSGALVRIVKGDLTAEEVDAIVNAANERLRHGGGVAGAIARKGGPEIQEESDAWIRENGPLRTGAAAITGAGSLPARRVIHAVGPVWEGSGQEDRLLDDAVRSALRLAAEHGLSTVSLPAISSGIFGFPKERCARVLLDAVERAGTDHDALREIRLVNVDDETARIFEAAARARWAGS